MIVDRYLIRAIVPPWLTMTAGLALIFASYSLTQNLADAAQAEFAIRLAARIIGLRVVIALEVLVPLGLYLGTIIGLGRLYSDQEMIALQAGGVTQAQVLRPLVTLALMAAALVAILSIVVRPWAYGQVYRLEHDAQTQVNLSNIAPDSFYSDEKDGLVIYAEQVHAKAHRLDNVFASAIKNDRRVAIRAASMTRRQNSHGPTLLVFHDGHLYDLDRAGSNDRILRFKTLNWTLNIPDRPIGYRSKAASSAALWQSHAPADIAERQWRFSRPVATLLLALLGIFFARAAPRRGRAANVFAATLCFVIYYNLTGVARSWVEQRAMPTLPGIYWVDGLVLVILAILWLRAQTTHY